VPSAIAREGMEWAALMASPPAPLR
jgi:hypothetical protein